MNCPSRCHDHKQSWPLEGFQLRRSASIFADILHGTTPAPVTDAATVDLVLQQLVRAASEQKFAVIAYCFMPDHLHVLSEGTADDADCKRFMKAFKQYSGYYYSQRRHDTLWQRYGFEHVLRDDEVTVEVAKYILANPVRAGLAAAIEQYPYVGSLVYQLKNLISSTSS